MKTEYTSADRTRLVTALLVVAGAVATTFALTAVARAITIPGRPTTSSSGFVTGPTGTSPAPIVIVGGGGAPPTDAPPPT